MQRTIVLNNFWFFLIILDRFRIFVVVYFNVVNPEAVENEADLNAGIHSYNNGVFPFVPRKYKQMRAE